MIYNILQLIYSLSILNHDSVLDESSCDGVECLCTRQLTFLKLIICFTVLFFHSELEVLPYVDDPFLIKFFDIFWVVVILANVLRNQPTIFFCFQLPEFSVFLSKGVALQFFLVVCYFNFYVAFV